MNTLYTLGYTGTKPEQILNLAQTLGAIVIDTRFSPRSRALQWTRLRLTNVLGTHYQHMPNLGNINYKNGGPIQINKPDIGVPAVVARLIIQPVILLCVCKDCDTCHRKVVAEMVQAASGCKVVHLGIKDLTSTPQITPTTAINHTPLPYTGNAMLSAPSIQRALPLMGIPDKLLHLHQARMF